MIRYLSVCSGIEAFSKAVDGLPYSEIVEEARQFITALGGFEKFAEWGLF